MSDFCDLPEFYDCHDVVGRKQHSCCECKAPILKGEKHVIATGKWEGEVSTYRQHLLCANACRFIRDKLQDGECICFGGLWEWHYETRRWGQDKSHEAYQTIRKMLADIRRRELATSPARPAGEST